MKILTIHMTNFGKFKDFNLDLTRGLNIIYGENEAGKSTIMNFIMMMFYGTKSRKKDILNNLRKKYSPWDGTLMRGYIVFEKDDRQYRIDRVFKQTNNKDEINVIDNLTGESVAMVNSQEPGEHFFKMTMETFGNSLFIDSEDLSISAEGSEDINKKLFNLISTSDENVSYKNTVKIIEDKLFSLRNKSGKKGEIVDLEEEIYQNKKELHDSKLLEAEKKEIVTKIRRFEKEIEIQNMQDKFDSFMTQKEQAENLNKLNEDRKILEADLEEYNKSKVQIFSELDDVKSRYYEDLELQNSLLKKKSDVFLELQELEQKKHEIESKNSAKSNEIIYSYLLIFGVIGILASIALLLLKKIEWYVYIPGALGVIAIIINVLNKINNRRIDESKKELELSELGNKIHVFDNEYKNIVLSLDENDKKLNEIKYLIKEKELGIDRLEELFENKKVELERIKQYKIIQAFDPRILEADEKRLERLSEELDSKRDQYLKEYGSFMDINSEKGSHARTNILNKEYEKIKAISSERFKNIRYVDEINARIASLEERLSDKVEEYKLITQTMEIMEESYQALSQDLSPILNKKTEEIFHKLTRGKYQKLLVSKDFEINFEDSDVQEVKNWQFLSSGARDQAYISLKIALSKLITQIEKPILFLDDIFVKFDENRAKEGVDFLSELNDEFGQIILFTCHRRILEFINDANKVELL